MAKKRTSMNALLSDTPEPEQQGEPQKKKSRTRHTSLYLPEAAREQLRVLAFHERKKQHDLVREAINMLFKDRGAKSIEELERAE
jgi:predicted DNA-binding protein